MHARLYIVACKATTDIGKYKVVFRITDNFNQIKSLLFGYVIFSLRWNTKLY